MDRIQKMKVCGEKKTFGGQIPIRAYIIVEYDEVDWGLTDTEISTEKPPTHPDLTVVFDSMDL